MAFVTPEPLIIADASPLIGLAKIGLLGILRGLAREVWIPRAVWVELTVGSHGRLRALGNSEVAGAGCDSAAAVYFIGSN